MATSLPRILRYVSMGLCAALLVLAVFAAPAQGDGGTGPTPTPTPTPEYCTVTCNMGLWPVCGTGNCKSDPVACKNHNCKPVTRWKTCECTTGTPE